MFAIDLKSRKPISRQIIDNIKELIVSGVLAEDEKLPSVREMASYLTVNPNTVQKAFRILEQQGYIYMSPGRGTFVQSDAVKTHMHVEELETINHLEESLMKLYRLGISKAEAEVIIGRLLNAKKDWR